MALNLLTLSLLTSLVLGKSRNEIAAVHLIKCYCVPVLTCVCEMWQLSSAEYHNVDVYGITHSGTYSTVGGMKAQLANNFIVVAFQ